MAKLVRSYRISIEVDTLIKAEAERLSVERGQRVAEADVIELAVVAWLTASGERITEPVVPTEDRRRQAEDAMRAAETEHAPPAPKIHRQAESVAQRRAREAKEHAQKLAESDTLAREMDRTDIEYDLENVPHQSALHVAFQKPVPVKHHYEVVPRKVKPLTRPHGSTEAKRRREQS